MEVETWFDEVKVYDIELGNHQQSTTPSDLANLIRSQRYQAGVETKTEYSVQASKDAKTGSRRFQEENGKELDLDEITSATVRSTGSEVEVVIERGNYEQSNDAQIGGPRFQEEKSEKLVPDEIDDAQTGSPTFQEENCKKLHPDKIEEREIHLRLHLAALQGKWDIAYSIYKTNGKEIMNREISKDGKTALHIAVFAGQTDFVVKLMEVMSKEAIRATDDLGYTAFFYAAASGKVELAKYMLTGNGDLATIRDADDMLPIDFAASLGHNKMVSYLYDEKLDEKLTRKDRIYLLVTLIHNDIYDVALKMVEKHTNSLATARTRDKKTALEALAGKNFAHQAPSGTQSKLFNPLCWGADQKSRPFPVEAYRLLQLLWQEVLSYDDSTVSKIIRSPPEPIPKAAEEQGDLGDLGDLGLLTTAAEQGNLGFLTTLIRSYPDLLFEVDGKQRSIFHIAVEHRHADVFKLIHEIGSAKCVMAAFKDEEENNLLHLAAKLSPQNKLDAIPGAALQLQHELLWFEEVKKVVKKSYVERKNKKNQTPGEIFLEEHKELIEKGEKWMRYTADSCMIVATLIATVVFAAAFTVPGGNNQAGNPIFLHEAQFQVFVIADAISLIFSVSAVLNFLSILTSRYALTDFLQYLPKKLVQGVVMLFISVVAMLVAYIGAIFIMFKNGLVRIAIPIAVIAIFPVVLFIWQQSGLLRDVVRSTYMSKSLFRPSKPTLFYAGDSGKAKKKKL